MYDIIIVGAGTAGLSAAIYGLRAGKTVLLLEENTYGGQIVSTPEIENYPGIKKVSGYEFATNLYEQAAALGAEIRYEKVIQIKEGSNPKEENYKKERNHPKEVLTKQGTYFAGSVILATGAKNRQLGLPREEELIGAGVSYCATCDGAFFRGKEVAVVGGGNTALEDALFLSGYCKRVYLIHRRSAFRGEEKQVMHLKEKENIDFVLNSRVTALRGKEQLEAIEILHLDTEKTEMLSVQGVFVAIGQAPDNRDFEALVSLDPSGYIQADESCKTSAEGIFTAGDCRTKTVRQLTTAAADGAVAALAACEYLG